jgi:hypothetical protein
MATRNGIPIGGSPIVPVTTSDSRSHYMEGTWFGHSPCTPFATPKAMVPRRATATATEGGEQRFLVEHYNRIAAVTAPLSSRARGVPPDTARSNSNRVRFSGLDRQPRADIRPGSAASAAAPRAAASQA